MHLIFDFDGTLVDSFQRAMERFATLAEHFNFRKFSQTEIANLRDLTTNELLDTLQIPIHKIPRIIFRMRRAMREEMPGLAAFPNLSEVLQKLQQAGFALGILTSNSAENVALWLERQKMQHLFTYVQSGSSFLGKRRVLNKIIRKYHINRAHAFYIGDETRDILAAKLCGIRSVAVTWGYNSEKALIRSAPDHLIHKPEELLKVFIKS